MNHQTEVTVSQARTIKPITAHPINGEGKSRVIPGGALVTIHYNPRMDVHTATAYMGGEPYEAIVDPHQFTTYHQ